ncbi:MAG: hypothetical protein IJ353_06175 [Lachnospiraceae bacterium]|nr:hypothetical protein [Lachnospiraceae bacterium]
MKRRGKLFLLLTVSLLVLAGWGQKKVELLSDKKLIDLSAAIGNCTLGADDMTPDDGTSTKNPNGQAGVTPTAAPTPTIAPRPTAQPTRSPQPIIVPNAKTIIISIRDEAIFYDLRVVNDMESLEKRITIENADHISFKLVDNYAEAHVFRRVRALLEELEAEIGIRYIIE